MESLGDWNSELEAWYKEADRADDVATFKRLLRWRSTAAGWEGMGERLCQDLRLRAADITTPAELATLLAKFDIRSVFYIDEELAIQFYTLDPESATPFILKRLPYQGDNRQLWETLFDLALEKGDDDFAYKLYRRQVPLERWREDVRALAAGSLPPTELVAELEKRHPDRSRIDNDGFYFDLIDRHGPPLLPYVLKHVRKTENAASWELLLELTRRNEWWDVWAKLIRDAGQAQLNEAIEELLTDEHIPPEDLVARLRLLSQQGDTRADFRFRWYYVSHLQPEVALRLYRRFPELLRTAFRPHIQIHLRNISQELLDEFLDKDDYELIDHMSSFVLTYIEHDYRARKSFAPEVATKLHGHYVRLLEEDKEAFAQRTAGVLNQFAQRGFIWKDVLKLNPLAKLFFEAPPECMLASPRAVQDLLESENELVRAVALRAIALKDERAAALVAENLSMLIAAMLQVKRSARRDLFKGLSNRAEQDRGDAARILARAREVLFMPDRVVSKKDFFDLISRILHRWPELRGERESLPVYGEAAS
jgi:hypothetical protein